MEVWGGWWWSGGIPGVQVDVDDVLRGCGVVVAVISCVFTWMFFGPGCWWGCSQPSGQLAWPWPGRNMILGWEVMMVILLLVRATMLPVVGGNYKRPKSKIAVWGIGVVLRG